MNINKKDGVVTKMIKYLLLSIKFLYSLIRVNLGILLILISLVIIFALRNPRFISVTNIINIGRQSAIIGILAAGQTFAILIGSIDLSVGSIVAFASVIAAFMMKSGISWVLASIIAVLVSAGFGLFNGYFVAAFVLPGLLVTLGSRNIIRGVGYIITNGRPVSGLPNSFEALSAGNIFGIPNPMIIMLVVFIICWFILKKTVFGMNVYAVGDNIETARLSGIKVKKVQLLALVLCGLFSGVSGILTASRLFSGQPYVGQGYELDAIAAVILGGASLNGGQGDIWGSFLGAVIIGVIHNGLNILGISPYVQFVLIGAIIVLAIVLDKFRKIGALKIKKR